MYIPCELTARNYLYNMPENGTSFATNKDIIFSAKDDIVIQAAQGLMPDNHLTMLAPHSTGYAMYLAKLGQPATVMFKPVASTVGLVDSQLIWNFATAPIFWI